jgi:hypothetical protein
MVAHLIHYLEEAAHTARGFLDEAALHTSEPFGFTPDMHSHAYNTARDTVLAMLFMGMIDIFGIRLSGTYIEHG